MPQRRGKNRGRRRTSSQNNSGASQKGYAGCPCTACTSYRARAGTGTSAALHAYYRAGYDLTEMADKFTPEEVEQDIPVLAHRAARLKIRRLWQKPELWAMTRSVQLKRDGVARCDVYEAIRVMSPFLDGYTSFVPSDMTFLRNHDFAGIPVWNCTCGFYANPPDLRSTYESCNSVNLMVELTGKIIECHRGYRAEEQRIVECQIPPCYNAVCRNPAEYVAFDHRSGWMRGAACSGCRPLWFQTRCWKISKLAKLMEPISVVPRPMSTDS